ncbi:hypothetical protein SAMN02745225_02318 [Ferrithrix thermotolerans DSM 19514]|uniref:Uncharacterized protein n=2 Tax=Ferrithrix TaxID=643949 RepID=A0A1M4YEY8_9ACTN|nr:hypothetical protein SAMN02745225_02318 [Ferrithrix thermotolerans DSM 19514]
MLWMGYVVPAVITTITPSDSHMSAYHFPGAPVIDRFAPGLRFDQGQGGPLEFPRQLSVRSPSCDTREGSSTPAPDSLVSSMAFVKTTQTRLPLPPAFASSLYDALRIRFMLRTAHLVHPASTLTSLSNPEASLPRTLASPWTGL